MGGLVTDGTDQSFMADVIEPSNTTPVLVDFWAPWCGPCKTLTPVIEKVVAAQGGKVRLVKINIDENPGVAGQLGVRSIPAVFAFDKGRPVDAFMGAQPESQIKQFIDKLLSGTDDGKAVAEALEQARDLFQKGDVGGAAQLFAAIAREDPENVEAIAGLARCYLANGDGARAQQTLDMVPPDARSHPDVKGVLTALELMDIGNEDETAEEAGIEDDGPEPTDAEGRYARAEALLKKNRPDAAVDHLFAILEEDMNWNEGAAKTLLLKVFEAQGPKAEVTKRGRRRLSGLLFS